MPKKYAFTVVVCSYLASCQSHRPVLVENYAQAQKLVPLYERQYSQHKKITPWVGPPPAPALRLQRTHPANSAWLLGHVALLLEDGKLLSQPGAVVVVDKQVITADKVGNYALEVPPGRYVLRGGGIGFLWSQAPPLQVAAGDSVRLDFQLLSDVRPIID
jgi:hypothetical protein